MLHDAATRGGFYVAGVALIAIAFLYLLEVVLRYFLNAPTDWTLEVIRYLLLVTIALAAPEVTRTRAHIVIDMVYTWFRNPRAEAVYRAAIAGACMGACLLAAYILGSETLRQFDRGVQTNAAYPIPRWWLTAMLTYGFASMALHFLAGAVGRREGHRA